MCPWLKPDQALQIVYQEKFQFDKRNACPLYIDNTSIKKVLFGYTVDSSYDCSVTETNFPILKSKNTIFITFYEGLIGVPKQSLYHVKGE